MDQAAITDEAIYAVWTDPGMTRWAAAMRLGITPTALSRRARRLGLPMRERVDQRSEMTCVSDARIREVWSREDLTRKEQAHEVGLALSALSSRARRLGLPIRRSVSDHRIPAARIREVWLDPVLTVRQGAAMLGLAPASLRRRAEALGLPLRGRRGRPVVASKANEALFREMWMARVRAADMAVHFRVHPMTVSGHARRLGLARRAPSPRPIPLDRFWSRRREAELGASPCRRGLKLRTRPCGDSGWRIMPAISHRFSQSPGGTSCAMSFRQGASRWRRSPATSGSPMAPSIW